METEEKGRGRGSLSELDGPRSPQTLKMDQSQRTENLPVELVQELHIGVLGHSGAAHIVTDSAASGFQINSHRVFTLPISFLWPHEMTTKAH